MSKTPVVTTRCRVDVTAKADGVRLVVQSAWIARRGQGEYIPSIFVSRRRSMNSRVHPCDEMGDCECSVVNGHTQTDTNHTKQGEKEPEERVWRTCEEFVFGEVDDRFSAVALVARPS